MARLAFASRLTTRLRWGGLLAGLLGVPMLRAGLASCLSGMHVRREQKSASERGMGLAGALVMLGVAFDRNADREQAGRGDQRDGDEETEASNTHRTIIRARDDRPGCGPDAQDSRGGRARSPRWDQPHRPGGWRPG